jgi:RNA polymerase sigma-54 factor
MAFELKQNLKLTQQLVMTPQLQQAIKLLQLSRLELVDLISQEIEENPLLEEIASDDYQEDAAVPESDTNDTVVEREEIKRLNVRKRLRARATARKNLTGIIILRTMALQA